MARRSQVGLLGAAATLGTSALIALIGTSSAQAAGPGTWVQLSSGSGISSVMDPSVHRFGTSLQVVWTQGGLGSASIRTRILAAGGATASAIRNVLTWDSATEYPAIMSAGGHRVIVFSGVDGTGSDPYADGYNYYATSGDGLSWAVANGTIGASTSAYASYGSDAVNAGGTPLSVFTPGSVPSVSFHTGFDTLPPATPDHNTSSSGSFAYYPGVGYDTGAGTAWTAWYSNSGIAGKQGINAQRIFPTVGSRLHAPSSSTSYNGSASSLDPGQRVSVAARKGGGLYTAYLVGYPSPKKFALWKLGTSSPLIVGDSRGVRAPGVAAGPGGRLWVFWFEPYTSTLRAVRTNKAATRFGRACTVRTPHGTASVWKTAGDGSNGRLDLIVNAGGGTDTQIYATQVLPCLSAAASPDRIASSSGGTVTITVRDAGAPVAGARVVYNGIVKKTNTRGRASFNVPRGTPKGIKSISFSKSGYTGGKASFRVS